MSKTSPVASVSRRFGMGHMLVAMGLFALLFSLLQFLGASPVAYGPCVFFCVAIPVGQIFLYRGRNPRRASCLIGARLLPVMVLGAMAIAFGPQLLEGLRMGWVGDEELARGALAIVFLFVFFTGTGYGLGYAIGTLGAGVFLVLDRNWSAGRRSIDSSETSEPTDRVDNEELPMRPTGYAWLDWIAWSPTWWVWQNRHRPMRNTVVITVLAAVLLAIGLPATWWLVPWQAYVMGAVVAAPLIGLVLSGLLLAGWRAPLVYSVLGMIAVTYPLDQLRQLWGWKHYLPEDEAASHIFFAGIAIGVIFGGIYGWVRWAFLADSTPRARRRMGLAVAALVAVFVALGCLGISQISNSPRQRGIRQVRAAGGHIDSRSEVAVERVFVCASSGEPDLLANIARIRELEMLHVDHASISPDDMRALTGLSNLGQLYLIECEFLGGAFQELRSLPALNALSVHGTHLSTEDVAVLRRFPNLRTFSLRETTVDSGVLSNVRQMPGLTYLDLTEASIQCDDLRYTKGVATLVLDGTNVSDEALAYLADSKVITSLSLRRTEISDAGLRHLAALDNLVYLGLGETRVIGRGLSHLRNLNSLTTLDLSGTNLDNAGLAQLPPLPCLKRLLLRRTRVTGEGLAALQGLTSLQFLDLSECRVDGDDLALLQTMPITHVALMGTDVSSEGKREFENSLRQKRYQFRGPAVGVR